MINVAMLSKWHVHAEGYAREINDSGKAKVVAVWDEDESRGSEWAGRLGADFIADLDAILARADIDAVVCCTPTTAHHDVLIKAAKAGKHIFTEKALCPVRHVSTTTRQRWPLPQTRARYPTGYKAMPTTVSA